MSSNTSARRNLEQIYGKGCMFKRANLEKRIEEMGGIKTYKKFVKETRYTRRKINILEKNLTYHHLQHQSEGGKTTPENGAEINELAHRYIHSLSRKQEEVINNMLREFKYSIVMGTVTPTDTNLDINLQKIDLEFSTDDCITIPLEDTTKEDIDKLHRFNRAKLKRETQKQVEEELYNYYKKKEDDDYDR